MSDKIPSFYYYVSAVTKTAGGSGYGTAPSVIFSGGGGTGATATAVLGFGTGVVDSIILNTPGTGYTSAPTITFQSNTGSGAAATASVAMMAGPQSTSKDISSIFVNEQLPDFVRAEYPAFVSFIEAYYRYLDTTSKPNDLLLNAATWSDIDNTLAEFLPAYKKQYLAQFPKVTASATQIDERRLIKQVQEFFRAKGSPEALKYLFRALYNEEIEIDYPSKYVLRASDGVWTEDITLRITVEETINGVDYINGDEVNPFNLKGKLTTIVYYKTLAGSSISAATEIECSVKTVKKISYNFPSVYELILGNISKTQEVFLPGYGATADAYLGPTISNTDVTFTQRTISGTALAGVAISGTAGQFTCTATTLAVGDTIKITGTLGGTGTITGYTTGTSYKISATNGTTTFTLQTTSSVAIVTTAGTPTGLTYTNANVNISTETFTYVSHGFSSGDAVVYYNNGGTSVTGLTSGTTYYVISAGLTANAFRVSASSGGSAVNLTGTGNVAQYFEARKNGLITAATHSLVTGDSVVYDNTDGTNITGLVDGTTYYIIRLSASTFKLATTSPNAVAGTAIDITGRGTGSTHTFFTDKVVKITVTSDGNGYHVVPDVTIVTDGAGSGATATAFTNADNEIASIVVTSAGSGYTTPPGVEINVAGEKRSHIHLTGDESLLYGILIRVLRSGTLGAKTTVVGGDYGFRTNQIYNINETKTSGFYVTGGLSQTYFAENYVDFGVNNNASIRVTSVNADYSIAKFELTNPGSKFNAEDFEITLDSPNGGTQIIAFTTGAIYSYPGQFADSRGKLSDVNRLQDNYYYQNYSYVIKSGIATNTWYNTVKNAAHPAGTSVFGELVLSTTLDFSQTIGTPIQTIVKYLTKIEVISTSELVIKSVSKVFSESKTVSETISLRPQKVLTETLITSETFSFATNLGKSDTATTSETLAKTFAKTLSDTGTSLDTAVLSAGKVFTDSTSGATDTAVLSAGKVFTDSTSGATDTVILSPTLVKSEALTAAETMIRTFYKVITETATATESASINISKPITDAATVAESGVITIQDYAVDYFSGDYVGAGYYF